LAQRKPTSQPLGGCENMDAPQWWSLAQLSHRWPPMNTRISVAELRARGVVLQPHEAVVIAQRVIQPTKPFVVRESDGPPSLENVLLNADGSVVCTRSASTCPSPKRVRVEFRANASHDHPCWSCSLWLSAAWR